MKIDILTLFPGMFQGPLTESLLKKAQEKGILEICLHDIRSFTEDKHHTADSRSFGGGPGMVMKAEPVYAALKSLGMARKRSGKKKSSLVVYMSPQGRPLDQEMVRELSDYSRLVLLCGHYEGIDERLMQWVDREVSIGDYVLTGGELPAMVLIDAVSRMQPGVVKETDSVEGDSFYNGLLDYPHYTRPAEFKKIKVPDVLLSGDHKKIARWRMEQSLARTLEKRPDLLEKRALNTEEQEILATLLKAKKSKA